MTELTIRRKTRTTATIMRGTERVGHIGLMCGGSCAFVNAEMMLGVSFVAHSNSCQGAFEELLRVLARREEVK